MAYIVREILHSDDAAVERVIRSCLIEFGGDHGGTAWADPMLGRFSEVYAPEGSRYWVACEQGSGKVVGGVGVGPLDEEGLCELQKMYLLPEARGQGLAGILMELALSFAKNHYKRIYLETLPNMTAAQHLYERFGFDRISEPAAATGHFACDVRYIRDL